jgi:hypothetical protein
VGSICGAAGEVRALLSNGEFENASKLLTTCDERLRGWEWAFLESRTARRIANVSPLLVPLPFAVNSQFRSAELLCISADGLLIAVHYKSFVRARLLMKSMFLVSVKPAGSGFF